jgi:hypothetical protein
MSGKKKLLIGAGIAGITGGSFYVGYQLGMGHIITHLINQYENGDNAMVVEATRGKFKGLLYELKAECIGD